MHSQNHYSPWENRENVSSTHWFIYKHCKYCMTIMSPSNLAALNKSNIGSDVSACGKLFFRGEAFWVACSSALYTVVVQPHLFCTAKWWNPSAAHPLCHQYHRFQASHSRYQILTSVLKGCFVAGVIKKILYKHIRLRFSFFILIPSSALTCLSSICSGHLVQFPFNIFTVSAKSKHTEAYGFTHLKFIGSITSILWQQTLQEKNI